MVQTLLWTLRVRIVRRDTVVTTARYETHCSYICRTNGGSLVGDSKEGTDVLGDDSSDKPQRTLRDREERGCVWSGLGVWDVSLHHGHR